LILPSLSLAWAAPAQADLLAFDIFVSKENENRDAGIAASDVFGLTSLDCGPPASDPYASDSLTFKGATLAPASDAGVVSTSVLRGVGPGKVLDSISAPVVQVSGGENFDSATVTVNLTPVPVSVRICG